MMHRIRLIKGDITAQQGLDAIVSVITTDMNMDGSLNQEVMAAAGEKLDDFILEHVYKPRPGDAFAVPGFNLPVPHIIYVVAPSWKYTDELEDRDLLRCYRHALDLAHRMGLKRVAFPAIGTGRDKFPVKRAARLALQGIADRLLPEFEEIRIVCNDDESFEAFAGRLPKTAYSMP